MAETSGNGNVMVSVRGLFENGVARPVQPVQGREGQAVIITFLTEESNQASQPTKESDWDASERLIRENQVHTGIPDLAHQHDHYLHGKPKTE